MILTIAHKEFRNLFATPSTWIILGVLQFIFSWFYLARLDAFLQVQSQLSQLANPPGVTQSVATPVLGTVAFIMMMLVPIFTMRLISEEKLEIAPHKTEKTDFDKAVPIHRSTKACELPNRRIR